MVLVPFFRSHLGIQRRFNDNAGLLIPSKTTKAMTTTVPQARSVLPCSHAKNDYDDWYDQVDTSDHGGNVRNWYDHSYHPDSHDPDFEACVDYGEEDDHNEDDAFGVEEYEGFGVALDDGFAAATDDGFGIAPDDGFTVAEYDGFGVEEDNFDQADNFIENKEPICFESLNITIPIPLATGILKKPGQKKKKNVGFASPIRRFQIFEKAEYEEDASAWKRLRHVHPLYVRRSPKDRQRIVYSVNIPGDPSYFLRSSQASPHLSVRSYPHVLYWDIRMPVHWSARRLHATDHSPC
ncbi:hypothetical protein IAR55_002651 [Kwoniella newhampshirensis]|uniref:Uncharacterized protein n=1 Tax=Kwoniella newhampshirensis TaxID=1651941 RepID=A0AAW0YZP8_9TREE